MIRCLLFKRLSLCSSAYVLFAVALLRVSQTNKQCSKQEWIVNRSLRQLGRQLLRLWRIPMTPEISHRLWLIWFVKFTYSSKRTLCDVMRWNTLISHFYFISACNTLIFRFTKVIPFSLIFSSNSFTLSQFSNSSNQTLSFCSTAFKFLLEKDAPAPCALMTLYRKPTMLTIQFIGIQGPFVCHLIFFFDEQRPRVARISGIQET